VVASVSVALYQDALKTSRSPGASTGSDIDWRASPGNAVTSFAGRTTSTMTAPTSTLPSSHWMQPGTARNVDVTILWEKWMSQKDRSEARPDEPTDNGASGDHRKGNSGAPDARQAKTQPDGEVIAELGDELGGPA
jgi:hypothetical protein